MRVWWTPLRAMKSVSEWYEAKSDEELIVALGLKLNPELFEKRWPTVEALLQDYLDVGFNLYDPETGKSYKSAGRSKAGMIEVEDVHTDFWKKHHADGECSFDALVQKGGYEYDDFCATYYKYEKGLLRPDGQPGFSTPSGRIELVPYATFGAWGIPPLAEHVTALSTKRHLTDEEYRKEYPFICINGSRSYEFFHSENRQQATMREFHPWPLVKISPQTAEEYGINEGEWIWIENTEGRCKQVAHIDPVIDPHYIHAEHGWWYPEQEPAFPHLYRRVRRATSTTRTADSSTRVRARRHRLPVQELSRSGEIHRPRPRTAQPTPGRVVTRAGRLPQRLRGGTSRIRYGQDVDYTSARRGTRHR